MTTTTQIRPRRAQGAAAVPVLGPLARTFVRPFVLAWRHRPVLVATVRNELRGRFAGSVLGALWLVIYPLIFLSAFAVVHLYVFGVHAEHFTPNQYMLLVFCGLVPFLGFTEALSIGTPSVAADARLIKNTMFPVELVPVKAVFVAQATQAAGTLLLLPALAVAGRMTPWALLFPVVWFLQILLTVGIVWIFASLHVFLKDVGNVIAVLVLLLMWLSPIGYTIDMAPEGMRAFLAINPLYYLLTCYQDCLMLGRPPRELGSLAVLAVAVFVVGGWFFSRLKTAFADHV